MPDLVLGPHKLFFCVSALEGPVSSAPHRWSPLQSDASVITKNSLTQSKANLIRCVRKFHKPEPSPGRRYGSRNLS